MSTLQKAAAVYQRPLITFFMSNPPARAERGEDFRTSSASSSKRDNAILDTLVRNIRARQEMLREVLEDEEEAEELAFIGSATIKNGVAAVVGSIRSVLGIKPDEQRKCANASALFTMLRNAAEKVGIYVLLLGDAGSYHSDISEDVFRGFALALDSLHDEAPGTWAATNTEAARVVSRACVARSRPPEDQRVAVLSAGDLARSVRARAVDAAMGTHWHRGPPAAGCASRSRCGAQRIGRHHPIETASRLH